LITSSHVADGPPAEKDLEIGQRIQGRMEASQRGESVVVKLDASRGYTRYPRSSYCRVRFGL
jgi:hypothetical protein